MKLVAYPGCCTARVMVGFGGTDTANYAYRPEHKIYAKDVVQYVDVNLEYWERSGIAIIHAIINTQQTEASEGLLRSGFVRNTQASKNQHAEVDLISFTLNVREALKIRKELGQVKVRDALDKFEYIPEEGDAKEVAPARRNVDAENRHFKVGDRVLIQKPANTAEAPLWVDCMDYTHGEVGVVGAIHESNIRVKTERGFIAWAYHPKWLFKLDRNGRARDVHGRFV